MAVSLSVLVGTQGGRTQVDEAKEMSHFVLKDGRLQDPSRNLLRTP